MDITSAVQAETLVEERVLRPSQHEFVIQQAKTEEHPFGWVVFYTTPAYLKSKHPRDLVPGAGPVIVLRDGELQPLSTSLPPAAAIQRFELDWTAKQHPRQ